MIPMLKKLLVAALLHSALALNSVWTWNGSHVPPARSLDGPYNPSACGNGGQGGEAPSFACPHHAMLSDDMLMAARYDNLSHAFAYAVAGSASDSLCGQCYQVHLLDAERVWRADFPLLVVQVVNSGFDVMQGLFDVFVGAGGMGYFTACNRDCGARFCNGGPCREGLFDGTFDAWTYSPYPDPNPCYGGGLRLLNETSKEELASRCRSLGGGNNASSRALKDEILHDTCVRGNLELFHQNFVSTKYLRVKCPKGLYMLTGLRRDDEDGYPDPDPALRFTNECRGSREQGHYCVTSMADCCVPSCAWPGKVNTDPSWRRVDRCDSRGLPMLG